MDFHAFLVQYNPAFRSNISAKMARLPETLCTISTHGLQSPLKGPCDFRDSAIHFLNPLNIMEHVYGHCCTSPRFREPSWTFMDPKIDAIKGKLGLLIKWIKISIPHFCCLMCFKSNFHLCKMPTCLSVDPF